MTFICITGNETSPQRLEDRLIQVLGSNERLLCELRLDYLDLSPSEAFHFLAKLPREWSSRLVLTQRLKASGVVARGQCNWDVLTWQSWWKDVMALKPWFAVDLDWLVLDQLAGESLAWQGTFKSKHAFFSLHGTLEEIERQAPELEASARAHNAGVKIACPVSGAKDLDRLAKISANFGNLPLKITVAMGPAGRAWRWSRLAGNISYFAFDTQSSTAAGQDTFQNVLPYANAATRPDLYVLWSVDAQNTFGEQEWNRSFLARENNARYLNIACIDAPDALDTKGRMEWANAALSWMEKANIKGASITQPFKENFPLVLQTRGAFPAEETSINTLKHTDHWTGKNTDGSAVEKILLEELSASWKTQHICILGGGGAAQAVHAHLSKKNSTVTMLRRLSDGSLPVIPKDCSVLISTWPASEQRKLAVELEKQSLHQVALVVDAQFSLAEAESPLALFSHAHGIQYMHGTKWWKAQALAQDTFWFEAEARLAKGKKKLLGALPTSKSETIRALAIAAVREARSEIIAPSICEDTQVMSDALEKLGVHIEKDSDRWIVYPPSCLQSDESEFYFAECATAFRMIASLAPVMQGEKLILQADTGLQKRPMQDLWKAYGMSEVQSWPVQISLPKEFPTKISVEQTSQFATGLLVAAAAQSKLMKTSAHFEPVGEFRSFPYFKLTKNMLENSGFAVQYENNRVSVSALPGAKDVWKFRASPDASSLSYLELLAHKQGLASFYPQAHSSDQADMIFPKFLLDFERKEAVKISLQDSPDLAPSLWAAAILYRRSLEITHCPQLHHKECDRAQVLVDAAKLLGLPAEAREDGFILDARAFQAPEKLLILSTHGDHRMSMAFAMLEYFYPSIAPDDRDCVKKSFPAFWEVIKIFRELLP